LPQKGSSPLTEARLPFLPRSVGVICGRESAAMRDVVDISRRRWPAVDLEVREVAVQVRSQSPR
jgi:exodeoxyribonuclease VII large subunit